MINKLDTTLFLFFLRINFTKKDVEGNKLFDYIQSRKFVWNNNKKNFIKGHMEKGKKLQLCGCKRSKLKFCIGMPFMSYISIRRVLGTSFMWRIYRILQNFLLATLPLSRKVPHQLLLKSRGFRLPIDIPPASLWIVVLTKWK